MLDAGCFWRYKSLTLVERFNGLIGKIIKNATSLSGDIAKKHEI
jgi:hypothetical protein